MKSAESGARDIQIALADQLAVVCDVVDVDFRALEDSRNEFWRDESIFLEAGPAFGGHSLHRTPSLLVSPLPDSNRTVSVARACVMSSFMPSHLAANAMLEARGSRVGDADVSGPGLVVVRIGACTTSLP